MNNKEKTMQILKINLYLFLGAIFIMTIANFLKIYLN